MNATNTTTSAERVAMYALQNAAYQAKQTEKLAAVAALVKSNPHLIHDTDKYGAVLAAKNIRIELKRAFPSVKFSVTSKSYTGGNSLRIRWEDGPTTDQVEAITGKYSDGHFNGMTDSYEYAGNIWGEAFGSAMYIFTEREYSDKMLTSVIGRICRYYGLKQAPTADDYNHGKTWNLHTEGGIDIGEQIRRALQNHTYCLTQQTGSTQ